MTIYSSLNYKLDETITYLIKWPKIFVGLEVPIIGPHTLRYVLGYTPIFMRGMWLGVDVRMNTKK